MQGVDLRPYRNYIMQNNNLVTPSSNGLLSGELFFVLSMGSYYHGIHSRILFYFNLNTRSVFYLVSNSDRFSDF